MSQPQDLYQAAAAVLDHHYAKYSQFPVACALRSGNGSIFAGVNVENASYSATLCAESSAIGALITSGDTEIVEVLILVPHKKLCPPCGSCRQRLSEFAKDGVVVHLCNTAGKYQSVTMGELMPFAFDSDNIS